MNTNVLNEQVADFTSTIPDEAVEKDNPYNVYKQARTKHWDSVAVQMDSSPQIWERYYHHRLQKIFQFLAGANQRILEIGCAQGDLLASLNPSYGVGIDLSAQMIQRAEKKYPHLHFIQADACELGIQENRPFDFIILSDILNDVWDIQTLLDCVREYSDSHTRLIINIYSRLWELPLAFAEKLGMAKPVLYQNWVTVDDLKNILDLSGFESIRSWQEILFPIRIPGFTELCNHFLIRFWPFQQFALTNFILARPKPVHLKKNRPSVTMVIPARNEAGNVPTIFANLPKLDCPLEIIFIEGHSKDNTYEAIENEMRKHPELDCKLFHQTGIGKGNAVREGFEQASGDILMILDADLTMPPSYLPRFYDAIVNGVGDFINGVRLVYPMQKDSMQFFNLIGNKFFCLTFSWLIGQVVKDTLCGTKVLWREDYERIVNNRAYFGDFDPFGDFDLLLGAAKLGLKIVDMPIRYRERVYGTTNIQRWKHGWLLIKMTFFAAMRMKFI